MIFALIYWTFIFLMTVVATHNRNKHIVDTTLAPLHDISNILNITLDKRICDILPLLCIFCIENYEKYVICHAHLLLLRFVCFNATILPPLKDSKCRNAFGIIPTYQYDLIFSGHTTMCVLTIYTTCDYLRPLVLLLSVICSVVMILSKEHYTIDVLVAWMATHAVVATHSIPLVDLLP